jgi:hypothetical protein
VKHNASASIEQASIVIAIEPFYEIFKTLGFSCVQLKFDRPCDQAFLELELCHFDLV